MFKAINRLIRRNNITINFHIYTVSTNVEFKLYDFQELIYTLRRTIIAKVRKDTVLKVYKTLV